MELYQLAAHELNARLKAKEITATSIVEAVFSRIEKVEDKVKAYITLNKENALKQASYVDQKIKNSEDISSLCGIPIAVKDNMCTKGLLTTCGSKILENYIPVYTATAVKKVLTEDAVIIGKANMDEFAMGSSCENSYFYPTRNPWDLERVPGGSSGGSAAAVAAGEATLALGSDTGGSIRQPAALCGVVGLKPTYGLVSRYGLVAFASSLDQIGTITKDVRDAALLLRAIAGHDPFDSTSVKVDIPNYEEFLGQEIKGLKVGIITEFMGEGVDEQVKSRVKEGFKVLEKLGATVGETSLPHLDYALSAYYIIAPAEASANLARFDGVRYGYRTPHASNILEMYSKTRAEGFGDEVKRRIMLGTYALSAGYYEAYYGQAQKIRTLIVKDFTKAFEQFDVLVSPTSPTTAFKIGEKVEDPLKMYMSDICTIPVNLAGLPAISIPCGLDEKGLPVGLQIIGKTFDEATILKVAYAFEQELGFRERPKL